MDSKLTFHTANNGKLHYCITFFLISFATYEAASTFAHFSVLRILLDMINKFLFPLNNSSLHHFPAQNKNDRKQLKIFFVFLHFHCSAELNAEGNFRQLHFHIMLEEIPLHVSRTCLPFIRWKEDPQDIIKTYKARRRWSEKWKMYEETFNSLLPESEKVFLFRFHL